MKKFHVYGLVHSVNMWGRAARRACEAAMLRCLPVRNNKIVFVSYGGGGYGDNPKYIARELLRQHLPVELVWLVTDLGTPMPSGIRKVRWGSIRAKMELATARVWIKNSKIDTGKKRNGVQFYIQTWHGTMPLKHIEQDAEKTLAPYYVNQARQESRMIDLMLASCRGQEKLMAEKFWYDGPILTAGAPRNDLFFHDLKKVSQKVRACFHIAPDQRIVLFAPTFRSQDMKEVYELESGTILSALKQRFHQNYVMLKRLHPNIAREETLHLSPEDKDATMYPDMQELLAAADVLITDYSGCMYDFSLMKKPVFLIGKDYDRYRKTERGMYRDITDMPFPFARNEEQLRQNILTFDQDLYQEKLRQLWEELGSYDNGNAAAQVVEIIRNVIGC